MNTSITFTKVNDPEKGNFYVCHFLSLLSDTEKGYFDESMNKYIEGSIPTEERYLFAIKRAKSIDGRKFHNRKFGGGIAFYSSDLLQIRQNILSTISK